MVALTRKPLSISRKEAVRIAYAAQFLGYGSAAGDAADNAAAALSRLGYVQIDTISVVERAHHHTLWSRDRSYRSDVLPKLEAEPRRALEYWAHAAAYLPIEDYRFCLPRMRRVAETGHEWFPTDERIVAAVLETIRAEGPKRSSDFQSEGPRGPWWDWKPAKAALEYLFMSGSLLVAARPGFQKLYDLAERVLPPGIDSRYPCDDEMGDWYVHRAMLALGVFAEADVAYMRKDCTAGLRGALERAVEAGSIVEARIEGDERKRSWASKSAMDAILPPSCQADDRPARILSPFDNYIIDRKRARRLLGIDYTLECYVPAEKRAFGYFSLPVIWRGGYAGLIDCKADRKAGVLIVNRAEFEPDAPEGFESSFAEELEAFSAFNGCSAIDTTR